MIKAFLKIWNRWLYLPFSKLMRIMLDRKIKHVKLPKMNHVEVNTFFSTCEWTRDHLWGVLDYFKDPRKFYLDKKGDCDDYAVFAANVLDTKLLPVIMTCQWKQRGKIKGHNVCLFSSNRLYYHISNWGIKGPFPNIYMTIQSIVPLGAKFITGAIRDKNLRFITHLDDYYKR